MKLNLLYVLGALLMATFALCQDDEVAFTYQIMHRLSSQKDFVKRGDITLKSNKSQIGNYIGLESKDSAIDAKIGENDLYLVEIRDTKGNVLSSSYTKACSLIDSEFKDEIVLHVDGDGKVLFADYFSNSNNCPSEIKDSIPAGSAFKTSVRVLKSEQGQRPHLTPLKYFKREQAKKQLNEKGFFAKYWMYILPVVFILLFTGGN